MTYECEFCKSILATEWSLLNHQKRTKKCLIKQGIIPTGEFKCDICNESFLYKRILTTHFISCNRKNNIELNINKNIILESEISDFQVKYKELKSNYNSFIINSNEKYNKLDIEYKIKYKELESKYNLIIEEKKIIEVKYDNLLDKLTTSAMSKTNTVNKHNNTINISTYTRTDDEIKNIYDNNITAEHIEGGISCIAKLIVDKVITDDNGNKMITITDKSRGTAKYKLPSGEVITDIGLNTFTTKNRDMVMKSIYNVCKNPELSSQILDEDTRLCQGYNEISDDNEGDNLKRNLIKNIG